MLKIYLMSVMKIPDKFEALKIYCWRAILNSQTNEPFISGDAIANLCEVSVYSPMRRKRKLSDFDIQHASSIFVPGHKLDEFLAIYGNLISAKVLVVGNSDRDFFSLDFSVPDSVQLLLLQNSHIKHDKVATLPIGIENLRYGKNGFKSLFKTQVNSKINKVLIGPFSNTHPERTEIKLMTYKSHAQFAVLNDFVSPKQLASIAQNYSYVACPRGNGTDTHRFWESIYRGSIPIVKRTAWSSSLKKYKIPFIEIETWDSDEVIEKVNSNEGLLPFNPKDIAALWLPYWKQVINVGSNNFLDM